MGASSAKLGKLSTPSPRSCLLMKCSSYQQKAWKTFLSFHIETLQFIRSKYQLLEGHYSSPSRRWRRKKSPDSWLIFRKKFMVVATIVSKLDVNLLDILFIN
ncbi:hypothetical protein F511_41698 [Dorcoceras hygrometricum]|uniref:Uncharacterized protein n=1 Tax=Dorcoceras hygrometricum TaxID=472368 RepID=A0A2Z7D8P8_9LAMI|nr:hypothetical protein F511_41764 [Dorcoceras hygrometricum]KZV55433.1 hypothetical protein F511_41698 [Dorcoceras hygrometricum]